MKDLPAYKQTALGPLPIEWQALKMKDVCKVNQGLQIPISERYLEQIPNSEFYITNEFLKVGSKNRFYILDAPESVKCVEDDILMTRTGNTGMVVTNVKGAFHNNFFKIKYDKSLLHKYFLVYFLRYPKTQHKILFLAGNSTIPDLNHSDFYSLGIQLPPLPEQQKIAEILSTWDKAIETCQKTIEELRLRNKGLSQQLLSGKKRVKGFEETIWKTVKMRNIGKIPKKEAITDIGNHRTLTVRLYAKGVDFNDSVKTVISTSGRPYYVRYKDEILIGRQNIHNGGIGIVNEMQSGNICSNAISSFVVNEKNDLKFIFIKLSTPFVYKRIENFMGGTGQKELSENEWLKLEIKIPEKSEQKAISKILDTASSELKHYEEKLQNLKLQKKGLMQQLLTGKVRTV